MSERNSLGKRLQNARQHWFVGRQSELQSWRTALEASDWQRPLWHLSGLGGIGKSSLLREMADVAREAGACVVCLDARDFEATPEAFTRVLCEGMDTKNPLKSLENSAAKGIIFVDTFEKLAALENWLRSEFLPALPENCAFVAAGREPLPFAFRADAAWASLWQMLVLNALDKDEALLYLQKRGVDNGAQSTILKFSHGHPLALSLGADLSDQKSQQADWQTPLAPLQTPEVVGALLRHLVQQTPSKRHAQALEASAVLHVCNQEILESVLDEPSSDSPSSDEIFNWLRGLSFMQSNRWGVFPHDLTRDLLLQDVRWRNPSWHEELHRRARQFYARRVHELEGLAQERIVFDSIFLHRQSPVVGPFLHWGEQKCALDSARKEEWPLLLEMVERNEGSAARDIAWMWFQAQGENVVVVRDGNGMAQGFLLQLALHRATKSQIERDPGALAAHQFLRDHAPLRGQEKATLFRFWMARENYQNVSPAQSLIFVQAVRHYLTTPGLAFTLFPCANPEFWRDGFVYADLERFERADFEVEGRKFGVYGHDWRARPVLDWLDLLMQREIRAASSLAPEAIVAETSSARTPFGVLSEETFRGAVKAALRNTGAKGYNLEGSVLLQSALVGAIMRGHSEIHTPVAALRFAFDASKHSLAQAPRCELPTRALELLNGNRTISQEEAAAKLNVSHSTLRRALRAAEVFIADYLWHLEIKGVEN